MLYKVFDFADKEASDVMVPRPEVVGISVDMPPEEALAAVLDSPYTRYPVYRESLDDDRRRPARARPRSRRSTTGDRRGRARGAPAARLHRPRDEGPRRAAGRVPPRRTSTWRSSSTSTARCRGSSRSRTCSRRSSARSRTSSTCPTSRSSASTRRPSGSTAPSRSTTSTRSSAASLEHEDFHTVAGYVFDLLGRAAEPGDEVRVGRAPLHGARDRGLADPAARGRVR